MNALKRYLCRRPPRDTIAVLEEVDAKIGHIQEMQEDNLAETRTIRRDLATIRRRLETGPFPILGDVSGEARRP